MNIPAVQHYAGYPDVYLASRKNLVVTIHAAAGDIRTCELLIFPRISPEKISSYLMQRVTRDGVRDHFTAEVITEDTLRYLKYYFRLTDTAGKIYFQNAWETSENEPEDGFYEFLYANETNVLKVPEWAKGVIYYQIFPERFANGDSSNDPSGCQEWGTAPNRENYMGGDLSGILKNLEYLNSLGVECLYLNPIFKGDFNHKYATTDYLEIDPSFGTKETFQELVETCHKYGIKIVLDGVFNHCGIHFAPFQDILEKQELSRYCDWFYIRKFPVEVSETDAVYECVGDYGYMPKLNTANPEVQAYIYNVMVFWLNEYHIDGWRLDVADEIDPSLWTRIRYRIKSAYPDCLLLGETWGDGFSLLDEKSVDSIMNYVFRDSVRDFLARGSINAKMFNHRICQMRSHYPEEIRQALFQPLDSHDTERFLWNCSGDIRRLKLAALFQMCFPGAPSIYYGDEIGLNGDNDPDCRRCMEWNPAKQNADVLSFYKKIIRIRKKNPCLRTGNIVPLVCEKMTYGYLCQSDNQQIYVLINVAEEATEVRLPVLKIAEYKDLLTGKSYQAEKLVNAGYFNEDMISCQGTLKLSLRAFEGIILKTGGMKNEKKQ